MKHLILLCLLAISSTAYANNSDAVVNKFFASIEKEQYEKAIVESFMDTYQDMGVDVTYESVKTDMGSLISQFQQIGQAYGAIEGYDLIVEKSLGKRYKRAKYILYFNQEPVQVVLALYAPKGKWGVRNIYINTYLVSEFEKEFSTLYE